MSEWEREREGGRERQREAENEGERETEREGGIEREREMRTICNKNGGKEINRNIDR